MTSTAKARTDETPAARQKRVEPPQAIGERRPVGTLVVEVAPLDHVARLVRRRRLQRGRRGQGGQPTGLAHAVDLAQDALLQAGVALLDGAWSRSGRGRDEDGEREEEHGENREQRRAPHVQTVGDRLGGVIPLGSYIVRSFRVLSAASTSARSGGLVTHGGPVVSGGG